MDALLTAKRKRMKENPVELYREYSYFQFSTDGEGVRLRESRQTLFDLSLDTQDIREPDKIVIEVAIANDYVDANLINDNDWQPLQSWWWHLGKIRNKTYPSELLPTHLQAIYAETGNNF